MGAGVGCVAGLGWSCKDRWHWCHPVCPNLLCPAARLSRGVGTWPVASCPCPDLVACPCPADPTPAPGIPPQTWGCEWKQGWAPGLRRCWVCLAQGISEAVGAQRVPPAGTAGMASCSMHAARVTAATSTHAWGAPVYGGSWAGCSQQPGDPPPAPG